VRIPICLAIALAAAAQSFEVASVKPSGSEPHALGIGLFTYPGGRIVASLCTLDYLIAEAFRVQPFQIAGGPRWIHEDRFDIDAKPPASSPASKLTPRLSKLPPNAEQCQMLQALLMDRFHLLYHREKRDGAVYFLVSAHKLLRLQPSKDASEFPWVGGVSGGGVNGDGVRGTNASMALLAERLSPYLGRPVVDATGIPGSFDFRSEYHSDGAAPDLISSILTSIQGLGLKLEAGRSQVETLVIERAEKPAAN
jgi:uncharacterized protein (TIGR03435 family)